MKVPIHIRNVIQNCYIMMLSKKYIIKRDYAVFFRFIETDNFFCF